MRRDPQKAIRNFNAGRDPERLAIKYEKMAESPFSYFRGACHLFYSDLASHSPLTQGPNGWICGDLHFENFGAYRGDNRLTYFDINDFDEALLAPVWWDVVRFLTSLLIGARFLNIATRQAELLGNQFLFSYTATLAAGRIRWIERDTADGMVYELLTGLGGRSRSQLLAKRTEIRKGKRRLLLDDDHALKATAADRERIENAIGRFAKDFTNPKFFRVLDVARRISGTGSLGLERYVVVIRGKGGLSGNCLLDVKLQPGSSLAPFIKVRQPAWGTEASRVVNLVSFMQAASPAFLHDLRIHDRSYTVRELVPAEDRLALDSWDGDLARLHEVIAGMGELVAWCHLRGASRKGAAGIDELVAFGQQKDWQLAIASYAQDYTQIVRKDWKLFRLAVKDGYFS